jgi:hypothetical protein
VGGGAPGGAAAWGFDPKETAVLPSLRFRVPLALLCALAAAPLGSVGFADLPLAFELRLHQPQVTGTVARMRLEGARAGGPRPSSYPAPRAT